MSVWIVRGRVLRAESREPVPGMQVVAIDRDLVFHDVLGRAVTGEEGEFTIRFTEPHFRDLFERRPDIFLEIHGPAGLLVSTAGAVRREASADEVFEILVPDAALPPRRGPSVRSPAIPAEKASFTPVSGYVRPALPGYGLTGAPGAVALLQARHRFAIPAAQRVRAVRIEAGSARTYFAPRPFPAQPDVPDRGIDPDTRRPIGPAPRFVELDDQRLRAHVDAPFAEVVGEQVVGPVRFVDVVVRPLRYDPAGRAYHLHGELRYDLDLEPAGRQEDTRLASADVEIARAVLAAGGVVVGPGIGIGPIEFWPSEIPCIILTDDYTWPTEAVETEGTTRPPTIAERGASLGGLATAWRVLAKHKTERGTVTRVVTVSDIVQGKHGDFTEGGFARDLAEVVRNFVKHAYAEWNTRYLLIGGDIDTVPMRRMAAALGEVGAWKTSGAPEKGQYHLESGAARLFLDFTPAASEPMVVYETGLRVPYDREAGAGRLGWYHTTKADFEGRTSGFTRLPASQATPYVIVEGPAADIDAELFYWVRDVNTIPSDFYYSSVSGPGYGVHGRHDFDPLNNGLYGLYYGTSSLCGASTASTVAVGRVPTRSAADVEGYVGKVIRYETLKADDGTDLPPNWLHRSLFVADRWSHQWYGAYSGTDSLPEGQYTHVTGETQTRIHLAAGDPTLTLTGGAVDQKLILVRPTETVVIPYDTGASATRIGWYFTSSLTSTAASATVTAFVRVRGPEADITGDGFYFDGAGFELAASDKERVRGQLATWFPHVERQERHYSDHFDPASTSPPVVIPLQQASLWDTFADGHHLVTVSGHGNPGWVAWFTGSTPMTNTDKCSVFYANSCSTARPDAGSPSLADRYVLHPTGGAVAYVGNSRYGWIGNGDDYEEAFWCLVASVGRVGPAASARAAANGAFSWWTIYAQNLWGDPELPVWTAPPAAVTVRWERVDAEVVRALFPDPGPYRITVTPKEGRPTIREVSGRGATIEVPRGATVTVTARNRTPWRGPVDRG